MGQTPGSLALNGTNSRVPSGAALTLLLAFAIPFPALARSPGLQDPPATQTPATQSPAPQSPAPQTPTPQAPSVTPDKPGYTAPAEVVTRDSSTTFKVRVNLVLVRVVVRDEHGKVVENLKKEDFVLSDNRKPQTISTFSMDTPGSHPVSVVSVSDHPESPAAEPDRTPAVVLPQRFVSLLFDDLNLATGDAVNVRVAAGKVFDSMAPSDRVGIYTTSGQSTQEFTADRALLNKALLGIIPRPVLQLSSRDCPDISYYQADLIVNKNNSQALAISADDALQCAFGGDTTKMAMAQQMASSTANRNLSMGDSSTEYAYRHMEEALRRLSGMPGQRKMVFISPGFILSTLFTERMDLVDRANRAGVVIDTLDARGLYTPDVNGDIADPPDGPFKTAAFNTSFRTP